MKVILSIGMQEYLCPSAAHAAKIIDLLGETQPCDRTYEAGNDIWTILPEHRYGENKVLQVTPSIRFVTPKEALKLIKERKAAETVADFLNLPEEKSTNSKP